MVRQGIYAPVKERLNIRRDDINRPSAYVIWRVQTKNTQSPLVIDGVRARVCVSPPNTSVHM